MMESEEIKRSLSADEGGRLFYFAISIVIFRQNWVRLWQLHSRRGALLHSISGHSTVQFERMNASAKTLLYMVI